MPRPGPKRHTAAPRNMDWPSWRYGPYGEAQIFQKASDVPAGWTKKPGVVFEPATPSGGLDRDTLIQLLADKGIVAHPTWSARYMKELIEQ